MTDLAVGISDLLAHRECPRRAFYGARRHTGEQMQNQESRTPEAGSPATWYGSAVHDAIDAIEDGYSDEAAVELAWSKWGRHLDAEHLTLIKDDISKFRTRDFENVRTALAEDELKTPLTTMPDGRPVFFRARIDRLYERLDAPGHFIHVDYKSSAWEKDQHEVDDDPQLWSYNWIIHECFPECVHLEQWMDQLRHGMVQTSKSDAKRLEIRNWLAIEARSYFAEHELREDGLPAPSFNQWCPWCPILESCAIVPELSDWALTRINELAPKDNPLPTTTPVTEYVARYDDAQSAIKVLERYVSSVKKLARETPVERRAEIGFELRERRNSTIDVRARDALYQRLGHQRSMELFRVTKERLQSIEDEEERLWALSLVEMVPGSRVVHRRR